MKRLFAFLCVLTVIITLASHLVSITHADTTLVYCGLTIQTTGSGTVSINRTDPDLQVQVNTATNPPVVILENSEIYVAYGLFNNNNEYAIRNFTIKDLNQNQVGSSDIGDYLDADAGRGLLLNGAVVYDGSDKKTVRLGWSDFDAGPPTNYITHEVTIYPNSSFLQIDYLDAQWQTNIVDLARPGGTSGGTHIAYGAAGWIRGYTAYNPDPQLGSYYNRYPPDGLNDPVDGGSLNYNNHFIVGVYNPANGVGYGRVASIPDTHIVKLLLGDDERRGLEQFPYPFYVANTPPFRQYLYAFTDGESEMLYDGQQLADGNGVYECGEQVSLTAVPSNGWAFSQWQGDVTGTNATQPFTVSGQNEITAVFTNPTNIHIYLPFITAASPTVIAISLITTLVMVGATIGAMSFAKRDKYETRT
jgi:hypothetical protein